MQSTLILCMTLLCFAAVGQNSSPESTCDLFLETISVEQGEAVNWSQLASLCTNDVQFRVADGDSLVTLDFEAFRAGSRYSDIGFREVATDREVVQFGNIASVTEEFQAEILSAAKQFKGMNMYHLIKVKGRWKITEVIYQIAQADMPLPSEK